MCLLQEQFFHENVTLWFRCCKLLLHLFFHINACSFMDEITCSPNLRSMSPPHLGYPIEEQEDIKMFTFLFWDQSIAPIDVKPTWTPEFCYTTLNKKSWRLQLKEIPPVITPDYLSYRMLCWIILQHKNISNLVNLHIGQISQKHVHALLVARTWAHHYSTLQLKQWMRPNNWNNWFNHCGYN